MHITELTLYCANIAAQYDWYAAHGWDVHADGISIGQSQLRLVASDHHYRYHYAIAVPANSISAVQRWWQATCQTPQYAPYGTIHAFDEWHADALYFRDAADNIVEFIAIRDPQAPTPTIFTMQHMLGICEIGIASSDVHALAAWCKQTLQLSDYYSHSPSFYPVGDDCGRLIIAERTRMWYPDTGVPADQTPCAVTLQTPQCASVLLTFTTPDALPHLV